MNAPNIVGAGTSGLSLAYYLRQQGAFVSCQDCIEYLEHYAHWLVEAHDVKIRYGVTVSGLSSLVGHLDIVDSEERLTASASHGNDQWPGLWVFGMRPRLVGNIYARVQEARRLAATIARQGL